MDLATNITDSSVADTSLSYISTTAQQSIATQPSYAYGSGTIAIGKNNTTSNVAWGFSNYSSLDVTTAETFKDIIITYLSEEEIKNLIEAVSGKCNDTDRRDLIVSFVSERHFSEAFLLEYIDCLSESVLYREHKTDICSGEYTSVALYLKSK